ncbi:type IV pilin protein, partial [Plesiomonas sp.]
MQKGLTLIELLITIVVATILMGVAVPSYQQLKDN